MNLYFLDKLEHSNYYTVGAYLPVVQGIIKENKPVFFIAPTKENGDNIVLHFDKGVLQDYAFMSWAVASQEAFVEVLKEGVAAVRILETEPMDQPEPGEPVPRPAMFTYEQVLELLAAARGTLRGRPIGWPTPTPTSIQPPRTELPR